MAQNFWVTKWKPKLSTVIMNFHGHLALNLHDIDKSWLIQAGMLQSSTVLEKFKVGPCRWKGRVGGRRGDN